MGIWPLPSAPHMGRPKINFEAIVQLLISDPGVRDDGKEADRW